jgi:transcriptional regulator with XRE-family HTH domain
VSREQIAAVTSAEKYGPKVRWLREGMRWSGRELCRRVGITPSYLSDIETGRRLPGPEVSDRIARALGVDRHALWRLALLERLSARDLRALIGAER